MRNGDFTCTQVFMCHDKVTVTTTQFFDGKLGTISSITRRRF